MLRYDISNVIVANLLLFLRFKLNRFIFTRKKLKKYILTYRIEFNVVNINLLLLVNYYYY